MRNLKGNVAAAVVAAVWSLSGAPRRADDRLHPRHGVDERNRGRGGEQPLLITSDTAITTANGVRLIIPATYGVT